MHSIILRSLAWRLFIWRSFIPVLAGLCLVALGVAFGVGHSSAFAGDGSERVSSEGRKSARAPTDKLATNTYQKYGLVPATRLESRVQKTPASVLAMFREPGVRRPGQALPTNHRLTEAEERQLQAAIKTLPPLHRRLLQQRLRVLSFLDGMPNTALTSTVNPHESFQLFDITVNAAILRQNVSEWLTSKERRCFNTARSSLRVRVDAGTAVDALVFVLLHEATHVVDMCERITPAIADDARGALHAVGPPYTAFTKDIWSESRLPTVQYRDPLRDRVRFYAGKGPIAIDQAQAIYESLQRTPFVSLYGASNWFDDLAEYVAVYHLTQVLHQPYRITLRRGSAEIFVYEPMQSDLVRRRISQMQRFYAAA